MSLDLLDYRRCVASHQREGVLLDRTLYALCDEHPQHTDPGAINAKLWLVGRGFATGVERQIKSSNSQGSSLGKLAAHLLANGREVDKTIKELRHLAEPLDANKLSTIVSAHGRYCDLVSRIARKKHKLVSFASKYLHFHAPVVPIYDSWVSWQAWRGRRKDALVCFDQPQDANSSYYWYCLCFWQLYSELLARTKPVSARLTECYLLWQANGWGRSSGVPG
jgi:hypothetical protein